MNQSFLPDLKSGIIVRPRRSPMTSRSDFSIMKAETSIFRVDYLESLNPHCPLRRRILVFGITEGLR
jgi:hypothetical protein